MKYFDGIHFNGGTVSYKPSGGHPNYNGESYRIVKGVMPIQP